jgi:hypothetical protein
VKRPGIGGPHVPLGISAIGHSQRATGTQLLGSYALDRFSACDENIRAKCGLCQSN